jgi:DNA/RNA endonuclease G (NUC1)/PKD repeat protein
MPPALSHRLWVAGVLIMAGFGVACSGGADRALAPDGAPRASLAGSPTAALSAGGVVISQVYGGGGNAGTFYKNDFIELYNAGTTTVSLAGWSVQYTSTTGTGWQVTPLTGSIAPGKYYLVQEAAGTTSGGGTAPLPSPEVTGGIAMGATGGKVALVNSTTALSVACPLPGASIVDLVGYGGANCFEGSGPTAATANATAALRLGNGAQDTDNNAADFTVGAPTPRNGNYVPPVVDHVGVAPATATVVVNATTTLVATAYDASNQPLPGVTFTWSSGSEAVATVNTTGVVTGKAVGTATITAAAPNGVSGSASVTVTSGVTVADVKLSEIHYDNDGADVGERIEVSGPGGTDLTGWKIYLYNGNGGGTYNATGMSGPLSLGGTIQATCGTRGVAYVDAPGIQNGDPDGIALVAPTGQVVEFLSYGGTFAATNGPANGQTSVDIGVKESSTGSSSRSLQRAADGTWYGPSAQTFGTCNPDTPPQPQKHIEFGDRLPSDGHLLVGYQGELFPSEKDDNGTTIPTTFTWVSETPSVATINEKGVLLTLAPGTATFRATAADGTTGTISFPAENPPLGDQSLYRDPLAVGTPTDATPADEFRITRPQYTVSYNGAKGEPNWVAYELSTADRGNLTGYRCDCFTTDPNVTGAGFYGVSTSDYINSGFDRGHMVRSNDRELARGEQATTYFMSNIVPQTAALNQHRWAALETYLQTVADGPTHPEVYIVAGPRGNAGTIGGGHVVIPTATWKVALVLPAGTTPASIHGPSDIIDLIAVDMPNTTSLPQDVNWEAHRVTVDSVEKASGYDLLSALPNTFEEVIESGDHAPTAQIGGTGVAGGTEGQTLAFSAATSSDPDVGGPLDDALSYQWSVDGVVAGIGQTFSHTFADNGTYVVRLIVADKFGAADTATTAVTVLNAPPVVAAIPGGSIAEGGTYTVAGSFADPGDDAWTATVDYGDGTGAQPLALSGKTFTLGHTYAQDGSYTVKVTVKETDPEAATGTQTATVAVANVAPSVAAFDGASILRGESYAAAGSFTDPGADAWTATVNYGDGTGTQPLALSGKTFQLSHTYATAGSYTVTVTVADDDETGSRTAVVVVKTPVQGTADLAAMVASLVEAGTLTSAEGTSLTTKLDAAAKSFAADRPSAVNQVAAFINEVEALRGSGRLSAAQAEALIAYAQRVIASAGP